MNRHKHRIVVEGMDGSGKTTLIERLTKSFPSLYIVPGMGPDANYNVDIPNMLDEEENGKDPIHDRFFYSELVYGPLLRGSLKIDDKLLQNIAWFLRSTAFLVYCRPYSDLILYNATTSPQMDGVADNARKLMTRYDELMEVERQWFPRERFFHYDYETPEHLEQLAKSVSEYLRT